VRRIGCKIDDLLPEADADALGGTLRARPQWLALPEHDSASVADPVVGKVGPDQVPRALAIFVSEPL
jgi:hypothetical protein